MEISRNQIVTVVLFLMVAWVYYTWNNNSKESFSVIQQWPYLPPNQWKNEEYNKWGENWYYKNDNKQFPIVPSIVNYDDSHYKFPKTSLKNLEKEFNKTHDHSHSIKTLPVPHNIHSNQTNQVAGTENVNQVGAQLDEVLEQEYNLMKPLNEIKQQRQFQQFPEAENSIKQENNQHTQEIIHELQPETEHKMEHETNTENSLIHELTETRPEMEFEIHNEEIQRRLMPGMKQKRLAEENVNVEYTENDKPIIVKVKKNDYDLSLAILLTVLLIGFIYYTRD